MKNMQSSLEVEERFVDGAIESLESLPTATATHELDVSIGQLLEVVFLIIGQIVVQFTCRTVNIHCSTPLHHFTLTSVYVLISSAVVVSDIGIYVANGWMDTQLHT